MNKEYLNAYVNKKTVKEIKTIVENNKTKYTFLNYSVLTDLLLNYALNEINEKGIENIIIKGVKQ